VASGGELARAMLALRLVLSAAPAVLVFDEVDAGIGGQAARLGGPSARRARRDHQVLVVTHLPQVAAFADHQVHVSKAVRGRTTVSSVRRSTGRPSGGGALPDAVRFTGLGDHP
jgi:DNA repair protein RecN (Recombination protein N)